MKKTAILLALLMTMVLTVTACGKKENEEKTTAATTVAQTSAQTTAQTTAPQTTTQTTAKNDEVIYGTEGEFVVFTASLDFKFDDESAWLGVIPTGTKYEKEADADEVDMIYSYAVNYGDENKKNYRFEFEKNSFFGIGDGTYDLVLTSSDNEAVGKVLLQLGIEIKGDKITLDFENKN